LLELHAAEALAWLARDPSLALADRRSSNGLSTSLGEKLALAEVG